MDEFCYQPAGLFVNTDFPHLGASPDGLIPCKCCGEGLLQIKCPYIIDSKTKGSMVFRNPKALGCGAQA